MSEQKLERSSKIDSADWEAFLNTFSNEYRGRPIRVEVVGEDIGDDTLASGALLDAIAYDPAGKGDVVVISFDSGVHHSISAVNELWAARTALGEIEALEFVDQSGVRTILTI